MSQRRADCAAGLKSRRRPRLESVSRETKTLRYRERASCRKRVVISTNFLYAHVYCGISARDIGTHVSKVCNASKMCAISDLICVTSSRSFLSSFASSVTAVSWCSTACSILLLPFTSWASNPALCPAASCSWFFLVSSAFSFTPFGCSNYGIARVRLPGCQFLPFSIAGPFASDGNGRDRSRLEFGRSGSLVIHAAQNTAGAVQTSAA